MASASALPPAQYFTTDHQNKPMLNTASNGISTDIQNSYRSGTLQIMSFYIYFHFLWINYKTQDPKTNFSILFFFSFVRGSSLCSSCVVLWSHYAFILLAKLFWRRSKQWTAKKSYASTTILRYWKVRISMSIMPLFVKLCHTSYSTIPSSSTTVITWEVRRVRR